MERKILGHPAGLYTLFMTEMWERFSYYGMRALLILYLTKHFLFDDVKAGMIYGSYVALIYGLPLLGGIIADRYLGMKKSVTFGAVLLVFGHLSMAIEGDPAVMEGSTVYRSDVHLNFFFLSISLIAVGVGFLKANISNLVGALYKFDDQKRDSGFTIFYMGINLGAFIATILCAYLGETFGWRYGFGAAGIGMFLGLLAFKIGSKNLENVGLPPDLNLLKSKRFGIKVEYLIYLLAILFISLTWFLFKVLDDFGIILSLIGLPVIAWLFFYIYRKCNSKERNQTLAMLVLMAFSVFFWALFEQAASSVTLFTDRNVNIGGELPAGMFQALNPFFIVLFAPVFAYLWAYLAKKNMEPNTGIKFALAILLVGVGFMALVLGANFADKNFKVDLIFLVVMYLCHTFGELCLSPVGLSMVSRLSVTRIAGLMMGIWFLSSSLAGYVSGLIAGLMAVPNKLSPAESDAAMSLGIYSSNFEKLAILSVIVAICLFLINPLIKRYLTN